MAKWKRGHIGRFWEADSYRDFSYVKKLAPDIDGKIWQENQYGSVYDSTNPMPEWVQYLDNKFGLKNQTYSFYKISPGEAMPVHVDHFRTYQKLFDVNYRNIRRVLVMLENWKPGHYLEIDGQGIVNWVAGDWFMWESDVAHSAANVGTDERYTLQITGEVAADSFSAWARLYSFNIPGRMLEKQAIIGPMISRLPKHIKEGPLYIYGHNQRIAGLDKITHDEETIDYLNNKGIHFYLYEPLCLYSVWKPLRQMGFYAEYKNNHKNEYLRADELDSIQDYAQKNRLTNITVHTGDYNADIVYGPTYPALKIICDDIFLKLPPNFPSLVKPTNESANFTKKFISLNWRYSVHRHIIAAYLSTLKDSVNITWYFRSDIGTIFNPNMWTDSVIWGKSFPKQYERFVEGITELNQNAPFVLDCDIKESTFIPSTFPIVGYPNEQNKTTHPLDPKSELRTKNIEDFYNDSFCDIVTESRFAQPTANYSEKAYQPMYYRKPFVLVAPAHTLKYLKEQGFKTFSEFWDESYDAEENHQERMFKILSVIDYINSKSIEELQDMYAKMQDILNHNKKLFEEKVKPMKKVAMIGLGKLGLPCAEVMSEHYDVTGYDIATIETDSEIKICSSLKETLKDRDIVFVAVPTPHDPEYGGETPISHLPPKDFDYKLVKKLLTEINKHVDKHQTIVLISTVLPGTVRKELRGCISKAKFIYNPYLIAMGTVKWDMVNPEMVIIGTEDGDPTGDAQELIEFYRPFMENNPRYEVGTYDEAEAIKIFYNTFISAKLALVNMIQDVAETNGNMNVDVVTTALAKSTHRITGPAYMKAGMGDGGSCHPRDNIALRTLSENLELGYDLFGTIAHSREVQAERMAKKCLEYGKTVCIVGKAFKPGVSYTYGSPSMLVGYYIEQHGGIVSYYDPNVSDDPLADAEVYLIGYIEDWVLKLDFPETAVVVDPWRTLLDKGSRTVHYGNTRIQ